MRLPGLLPKVGARAHKPRGRQHERTNGMVSPRRPRGRAEAALGGQTVSERLRGQEELCDGRCCGLFSQSLTYFLNLWTELLFVSVTYLFIHSLTHALSEYCILLLRTPNCRTLGIKARLRAHAVRELRGAAWLP